MPLEGTHLFYSQGALAFIENMIKSDKKWVNFETRLMTTLQNTYDKVNKNERAQRSESKTSRTDRMTKLSREAMLIR